MKRAMLTRAFLISIISISGCNQMPLRTDMDDSTGELGRLKESGTRPGAIYVELAVAYLRQGKFDSALLNAKKAIRVDPSNANSHNIIALIYERLGKPVLAEQHFQKGQGLDPNNSYLANAYGTFLCGRKRYDEAAEQFSRALENPLYKTPEVALANAGICIERKPDRSAAERYLRRALQLNPRFPVALIHMARLSYDTGEFLSSRAYLQRYVEVAKHTARSLWLGIRTEQELGNQDSVIRYSMLLRNNFPDSTEAQLMRESVQR